MYERPALDVINGKYVILEKLNKEKHGKELFDTCIINADQLSLFKFMAFGPFNTDYEFYIWLDAQEKMADRITYTVFSKRLNKYIGMCSIINIDETVGRAEIGSIWYGKIAQKTEINTEATFLLLHYLLTDLHYRRIEWKCDNDNIASKHAAVRLGFEHEGLFRKHMIIKNKNRDTTWYSIIDDEWIEKEKHFRELLLKPYIKKI